MPKILTDEFLISELHRFVDEFGFVPTQKQIDAAKGYPSAQAYKNHFKTVNNILKTEGLNINRIHRICNGTEVCSYCGCSRSETSRWYWVDDKPYCARHGQRGLPGYVKGNLDINSSVGLGRAGEILVAKTLKIANEFDCNRISCGYKFDLYHNEYKKIDVKTRLLSYENNNWTFGFSAKKEANTYICVGLSNNRSNVEHVWFVPNKGYFRNLQIFGVANTYYSLSTHNKWEVDSKPYNEAWKSMSLGKCKIMTDKSKMETEEEKLKFEKFKKEYFKKLGIKV